MRKMILIDFVNHALCEEQVSEMQRYGEYMHLRDINPELFKRIANCPDTPIRILRLINDIHAFLGSIDSDAVITLHLPLGSPAFMFAFATRSIGIQNRKYIFSHSERDSIEEKLEDGSVVKRSVFKFSHFIEHI